MAFQYSKKKCFFVIFLLLLNCKNSAQNSLKKAEGKQNKEINFDSVLKCSNYSYDDNCFMTADYGCIYNPKGINTYGNIIIYLVPKQQINLKDDEIEIQTKSINNLTINDYKNEFTIFIYLIDARYLNYNPKGDPIYYQKEKYNEELYFFDNNLKKWSLLDSICFSSNKENNKEQKWRDAFINKQILKENNASNYIDNIQDYIKSFELKEFTLVKEQKCDLNMDSNIDEILIFKNNKEYSSEMPNTEISPTIVLLSSGNKTYIKYQNDNIYPSRFQDLFTNLVVKDNFFTIELENEIPNQYFINKYITFKYDKVKKQINLHKYGETVNTKNKVYTLKEFGIIPFEEYNSSTIFDIISKTK